MDKMWCNRDWLWKHYIVRKEPMAIMAKEAGCGYATINYWLHKLGIPIHGYDSLWRNKDWLWEHYIAREEGTPTMAKEAGCSDVTIGNWLRKMNIPVRSCGEGVFLVKRNSVIIVPDLLKFLKGELLGDGCVSMPGNRSAHYQHSSKYEEYLIWLSGRFSNWGIGQTGRITDHVNKETGAIYYQYASRFYPELAPIYKRWYPGGKKIVPKDLELTPIMARQWYIGDGCLEHPKRQRPFIEFNTQGFDKESVEYLVKELNKLGFGATRQPSTNRIHLSVRSVQDFLKWIGPCPISCYDYKWDYEKAPSAALDI